MSWKIIVDSDDCPFKDYDEEMPKNMQRCDKLSTPEKPIMCCKGFCPIRKEIEDIENREEFFKLFKPSGDGKGEGLHSKAGSPQAQSRPPSSPEGNKICPNCGSEMRTCFAGKDTLIIFETCVNCHHMNPNSLRRLSGQGAPETSPEEGSKGLEPPDQRYSTSERDRVTPVLGGSNPPPLLNIWAHSKCLVCGSDGIEINDALSEIASDLSDSKMAFLRCPKCHTKYKVDFGKGVKGEKKPPSPLTNKETDSYGRNKTKGS